MDSYYKFRKLRASSKASPSYDKQTIRKSEIIESSPPSPTNKLTHCVRRGHLGVTFVTSKFAVVSSPPPSSVVIIVPSPPFLAAGLIGKQATEFVLVEAGRIRKIMGCVSSKEGEENPVSQMPPAAVRCCVQ